MNALVDYIALWGAVAALVLYLVVSLLLCSRQDKLTHQKTVAVSFVIVLSSLALYTQFGGAKDVKDYLIFSEINQTLSFLHKQPSLNKELVMTELEKIESLKLDSERKWARLGDMYQTLSLFDKADHAFKKALSYQPNNAYYQVQQTYCQVMQLDGKITPAILEKLKAILAQHPEHKGALNLVALEAYQRQDYPSAIEYWQMILDSSKDLSSNERKTLIEAVKQAKQFLGEDTQDFKIVVNVDIDAQLKTKIDSQDVLFVFIKHKNGSRMPIAVKKQRVQNFPVTLELVETDSMLGDISFSTLKEVVIGARISKSGQAIPQSGDLEGELQVLDLSQQNDAVKIIINNKIVL